MRTICLLPAAAFHALGWQEAGWLRFGSAKKAKCCIRDVTNSSWKLSKIDDVTWRRSSLVTLYSVHQLLSEEGRFEALALRVWKMFGPSAWFLKATSTKCQFFMPLFGKKIVQWEQKTQLNISQEAPIVLQASFLEKNKTLLVWRRAGCVILRKGRQCKSCGGTEACSKGFAWAGVGR